MKPATMHQARAAKLKAARQVSALAPVVGVGITRVGAGYGIKVNLKEETSAALPRSVDGVPLRFELTGRIRKRANRKTAPQ